MHHPDHAAEVADARRLGGLHRRREATLSVVYDVRELRTIEGNQRLLEVAAFDSLALENSVARNRTLVAVVTANAKLIEAAELIRMAASRTDVDELDRRPSEAFYSTSLVRALLKEPTKVGPAVTLLVQLRDLVPEAWAEPTSDTGAAPE
jgi:hypothetical protein